MSGMINGFIQKKKEKKVLAKVTWIFRKQWDLGHAYPRLYTGRGQQGWLKYSPETPFPCFLYFLRVCLRVAFILTLCCFYVPRMQGNNNKKSGVLNALRENGEIETKTSSEIMQVKYIWFVVIWNGVSKGFFFREIVN